MGSNVRTGTGAPAAPQDATCQDIYKSQDLFSPEDAVLQKVKINDNFTFEVVRKDDAISLIALFNGEKVGAIINLPLANCIERGHQYKGVVISIEDGLCILDALKMNP